MTKESLKESIRQIVDLDNVFFIESICKSWATKNNYKHVDRRFKAQDNAYDCWIDGKDSRITVQFYSSWKKNNYVYNLDHTKLWIVMRKHGGNYIIIGRTNSDRLIEIDRTGYEWHYDYEGLKALIKEYPTLFEMLGVKE